jgi:hypothetical protein
MTHLSSRSTTIPAGTPLTFPPQPTTHTAARPSTNTAARPSTDAAARTTNRR